MKWPRWPRWQSIDIIKSIEKMIIRIHFSPHVCLFMFSCVTSLNVKIDKQRNCKNKIMHGTITCDQIHQFIDWNRKILVDRINCKFQIVMMMIMIMICWKHLWEVNFFRFDKKNTIIVHQRRTQHLCARPKWIFFSIFQQIIYYWFQRKFFFWEWGKQIFGFLVCVNEFFSIIIKFD